jgi:hypothetical protein
MTLSRGCGQDQETIMHQSQERRCRCWLLLLTPPPAFLCSSFSRGSSVRKAKAPPPRLGWTDRPANPSPPPPAGALHRSLRSLHGDRGPFLESNLEPPPCAVQLCRSASGTMAARAADENRRPGVGRPAPCVGGII